MCDYGRLTINDSAKRNAWRQHYERLLNEEFPWNSDNLSNVPIAGPPILYITVEMVTKAIAKMKSGKAAGPSGIVAEMLKSAGITDVCLATDLENAIKKHEKIPSCWESSYIINLYNGKGDALERGNYRRLKLLDHVMKVMKRVIERIIRDKVAINEMQFGFMPRKGTSKKKSCIMPLLIYRKR